MRLGLIPRVAEVGDRLASKVASRVRRERASGRGAVVGFPDGNDE